MSSKSNSSSSGSGSGSGSGSSSGSGQSYTYKSSGTNPQVILISLNSGPIHHSLSLFPLPSSLSYHKSNSLPPSPRETTTAAVTTPLHPTRPATATPTTTPIPTVAITTPTPTARRTTTMGMEGRLIILAGRNECSCQLPFF